MQINQSKCQEELTKHNLIPRKYYGQVFTTDEEVIQKLINTIKSIYKPGTKIVEIGGGLGYITDRLIEKFDDVDSIELDDDLFEVLYKKFVHSSNMSYLKDKSDITNKIFIHQFHSKAINSKTSKKPSNKKSTQQSQLRLTKGDILEYEPPGQDYLLVGNIPFHISGRLYRKFMSDLKHKPYGMIFITDKQYATTLMGQPPRCYRVSLQAQSYGNIEIVADIPPTSVYPEPKVMSCIMKIIQNSTKLPKNFWEVVNYHFENFPTKEVESPKTLNLRDWIKLCKANH